MAGALRERDICLALLFLLSSYIVCVAGVGNVLGVNYGTVANNLPSPSEVVKLIQSTTIGKVKLYNADASILKAFANTGIQLMIGIGNEYVGSLADPKVAFQWVQTNVAAYMPATQITTIAVGNEVLATKDRRLISQLVPAMKSIHAALVSLKLDSKVKVSSPHSLGILHSSVPPSAGTFRAGWSRAVLGPMLDFLSKTGAPFMANAYPFFGYLGDKSPDALQYALFTSSVGYIDARTNLHYSNMFDAQLDAVYSAMVALGYKNVDIVVTETGWPSYGDPTEQGVSLANAETYNSNLIKHIQSNRGTPLRPDRYFETYIFALFNENLKSGPTSERNYGLFKPDMTPVYNANLMKTPISRRGIPAHRSSRKWCVAKSGTDPVQLQKTLNYACGEGGADCRAIQMNQACFQPNTLMAHASFAMNNYFQKQGRNSWDCYFNNSGAIVYRDPSYGSCVYRAT